MECIVCGKAINTSPDSVRCFGCASGYKSLRPTIRQVIPSDCVSKDDLRELVEKWEFRWKNSDQDYTWDCIQEAKKLLKREG